MTVLHAFEFVMLGVFSGALIGFFFGWVEGFREGEKTEREAWLSEEKQRGIWEDAQ